MNVAAKDHDVVLTCSEMEARELLEILAAYVCSPVIGHNEKESARHHYQKLFIVIKLLVDKRRTTATA
jgi:hypothetical protein